MGKCKRPRQKYHHSISKSKQKNEEPEDFKSENTSPLLLHPSNDLFAGLNINVDSLQTNLLDDDAKSVKSFKSLKSEMHDEKSLSKKEKRALRKQMLLKKIDLVNQVRKEKSKKNKKTRSPVMGDTKMLLDALPSLDSLLKMQSNVKNQVPKKKAVEKASKRQKQSALGVKLFRKIMRNKEFKKNPFEAISEHVNAVVNFEKSKLRK